MPAKPLGDTPHVMRWSSHDVITRSQQHRRRRSRQHRVFSDTETFRSEMPRGRGWEQFNKIMDAQFVTQMDGGQHARVRRLLMPAFSSRRIEQLQESIIGL